MEIPVNVPAQYNILGDGRVGFNIGAYDTHYPLVIDPALLYSSYLGGAVTMQQLVLPLTVPGMPI